MGPMRIERVGLVFRAIRRQQRRTQRAIAERAGISQSVYSRADRSELHGMTLGSLDRIATALGATLDLSIRYRGGLGDRLVDAAHARLVDHVVARLQAAHWQVELEFGFNVFGERGVVDILAWHAATSSLLIVEVKSRFTDLQAMLASLGRKVRLVPDVTRRAFGWEVAHIGRIVVAAGSTANRSVVASHPSVFDVALPASSLEIRRWIRQPDRPIAGLWLVSPESIGA